VCLMTRLWSALFTLPVLSPKSFIFQNVANNFLKFCTIIRRKTFFTARIKLVTCQTNYYQAYYFFPYQSFSCCVYPDCSSLLMCDVPSTAFCRDLLNVFLLPFPSIVSPLVTTVCGPKILPVWQSISCSIFPEFLYVEFYKHRRLPPLRRQGGEEYSSYSFLISAVGGCEWSATCPGHALLLGKGPPILIELEIGSASDLVWTQRLKEKSFYTYFNLFLPSFYITLLSNGIVTAIKKQVIRCLL
jgi:hypothetical protein